jgi:hypothetical protein
VEAKRCQKIPAENAITPSPEVVPKKATPAIAVPALLLLVITALAGAPASARISRISPADGLKRK